MRIIIKSSFHNSHGDQDTLGVYIGGRLSSLAFQAERERTEKAHAPGVESIHPIPPKDVHFSVVRAFPWQPSDNSQSPSPLGWSVWEIQSGIKGWRGDECLFSLKNKICSFTFMYLKKSRRNCRYHPFSHLWHNDTFLFSRNLCFYLFIQWVLPFSFTPNTMYTVVCADQGQSGRWPFS